jgi:hypothetical protein
MEPGKFTFPGTSLEDLVKAATGKSMEEWIIEETKMLKDGKTI